MLIDIVGVRKQYGGLRPLRVNALQLQPGQRVTLRGLDDQAAEMLGLLLTGASLPDEGSVVIDGRDTRNIATDTEWLASLDVFGLVTHRAVLLDTLALEANLALPYTLSIDPIPEDVRATVASLADEVGLGRARLAESVQSLSTADRARVHLARALAVSPKILILEHVTSNMEAHEAVALAERLVTIAGERGLSWLALTEDDAFVDALGGSVLTLQPGSGEVTAWTRKKRWTLW